MRLVKIPAMQLRPGMFVAELDRPWLETPFLLQGFVIRNDDEVLYVAEYVDYVYIDADYKGGAQFLPVQLLKRDKVSDKISIKAEFQQAKLNFESATQSLDRVFQNLKSGKQADLRAVRETVRPLIDGIFRNKDAMAALVRLKDASDYRFNHGISMAIWAGILGRHLGLHRDELEKLVVGCAMCDVGMTMLPDDLHAIPGALSESEWQAMRSHVRLGADHVARSDDADIEIIAIIENHHERFDGSGYPRGIEGATIPLLARIAGLVDTYDAMITSKPYAGARSSYEATQELIEMKDQHFQGVLVEQFIQAIGLFPTGALVELNTGEVGIVVKQNELRRLKPEVVLVLSADKQRKSVLELLDLGQLRMSDRRWITRELPPGSFNIDSEEFFL